MRNRVKAPIVAGVTGLMFVGGVAMAAFTGITPLYGDAQVATLKPLENKGVSVSDELWPGEMQDVTFRIKNPNPRAVKFIENGNWRAADIKTNSAQCSPSNFEMPVRQVKTGTIGAGATIEVTLEDAVGLKADAPNECMGVVPTFGWNFKVEALPNA